MTKLLYMENCYLEEFDAEVTESGENYVILDQTAFYPTGGGQDFDTGFLEFDDTRVNVTEVKKSPAGIIHIISGQIPSGTKVHGRIDWERRYKHMRMHTSQHLVSQVAMSLFNCSTVGNQIGAEKSRIDFEPAKFTDEDLREIEKEANALIAKSIPVKIYEVDKDEAIHRMNRIRVNPDRRLPDVQRLRIIEIESIDACPCGGTHISNLKEIGKVEIVAKENKGKGRTRIEYVLKDSG